MHRTALAVVLVFAATFAPLRSAWPCSAVMAANGGAPVVGRTYDWDMGQALVFVNKRGVSKQGLPLRPGDTPARWTSRWMSVTFNQYGRELPNGGMNEAGLVVEVLWLNATRYPAVDARPTLNELQWIQYQLDNFATVAEAVAAVDAIRISQAYAKVHYFVCDRSGDCAVIEALDGKMSVQTGAALTLKALTNDTWAASAAYAASFAPLGGKAKPRGGTASLDRFVRVAARSLTLGELGDAGRAVFDLLDAVNVPGRTRWFIVYEPTASRLHFRTARERRVKSLDLRRLDGACTTPVQMLDIDHPAAGDVTAALVDYASAANQALVDQSIGAHVAHLPPGTVARAARFPEQFVCTLTAR